MKKIVIILVFVLAFMEGVSWWVNKSLSSKDAGSNEANPSERIQTPTLSSSVAKKVEEKPQANQNNVNEGKTVSLASPISDSESFPPPSTEVVNGVTERTIHIGVRQWEWDPKVIRAREGELVRLVAHNADVEHSFVISELGVNALIPEEGAVVEFMAKQKGSFTFSCGIPGAGHTKMKGTLVIE